MKAVCVLVLVFVFSSVAFGQSSFPRSISYQGVVVDAHTNMPLTGVHDVLVEYFDSQNGSSFLQETHPKTLFYNGTFDLILGDFPSLITFSQQYWLQITINPSGADEIKCPRQRML